MAIYHPKIRFRGQTNYDLELIVGTFDPDNGAVDSYLDMEPVYTDSYDGSIRTDYGAKYNSVATPSVTFLEIHCVGLLVLEATHGWMSATKMETLCAHILVDSRMCSFRKWTRELLEL